MISDCFLNFLHLSVQCFDLSVPVSPNLSVRLKIFPQFWEGILASPLLWLGPKERPRNKNHQQQSSLLLHRLDVAVIWWTLAEMLPNSCSNMSCCRSQLAENCDVLLDAAKQLANTVKKLRKIAEKYCGRPPPLADNVTCSLCSTVLCWLKNSMIWVKLKGESIEKHLFTCKVKCV